MEELEVHFIMVRFDCSRSYRFWFFVKAGACNQSDADKIFVELISFTDDLFARTFQGVEDKTAKVASLADLSFCLASKVWWYIFQERNASYGPLLERKRLSFSFAFANAILG